jgi:uncharacterized membrane protein HdeD (DUF308 family)
MVEGLARNWWVVALRGLAAIVFGVLTILNPAMSLAVLILFFGAYALADGVFTVIAAVMRRRNEPRWVGLLVSGILGILIGALTFLMPGVTTLILLYLIASWAVVRGILEISAAIKLRKEIQGEFWLILAGALSIVFGGLLFAFPGSGALAVALWIGIFAIVFGIVLMGLAFRLQGWNRRLAGRTAAIA